MELAQNANKLIWVLEDDPGCLFVYQDMLDQSYKTRYFDRLDNFSSALREEGSKPDLVVADLTLKDGCFLNFLAAAEEKKLLATPFIVVSASTDIDALRFCFDEGALDYLTKPFKKTEFIVKLERLLGNKVAYEGKDKQPELKLTKTEQEIMQLFIGAPQRTLKRSEIVEAIWGDIIVHPKTLDVHLYNLRKKLQNQGMSIVCREPGTWILLGNIQ